MNGIAALCTFIASFSPPLGDSLMTLPTEIRQPASLTKQLNAQDARLDGPRIQGVIYFDGPIHSTSQRIYR